MAYARSMHQAKYKRSIKMCIHFTIKCESKDIKRYNIRASTVTKTMLRCGNKSIFMTIYVTKSYLRDGI